jgi:hypothetical protein
MPYILSFLVACLAAAITLGALVAIGATNGYENLLIIALITLNVGSTTAFVMTRRLRKAILASAVWTLLGVGGGFALVYALFASMCGLDPSAC